MSWICYLLALAWLLDALRMRKSLASIRVLPDKGGRLSARHLFITTPGIQLDENTRAAASSYADAENLLMLDLMPADTPALMALTLSKFADPLTYRKNRVAVGYTAGYAVLVSEELLERARIQYQPVYEPADLPRFQADRVDAAGHPVGVAAAHQSSEQAVCARL